MAITDPYASPNMIDGEGVYVEDVRGGYRQVLARLTDQLFEKALAGLSDATDSNPDVDFPGSMNGIDSPMDFAYATNVGGACPIQGSTNAKLKISPGTLFQKVNTIDGGDMSLLPFSFDGTQEVTIAAGSPTNPRFDIVEMKLELVAADSTSRDVEDNTTDAPSTSTVDVTWRVQCTLQVKAGTVAANPQIPAPDVGFVPICAVFVGTNYAAAAGFKFEDTAGATATIHDLRIPIGVGVYRVGPTSFQYASGANQWALGANRDYVACGTAGSTAPLVIPCPVTKGRILAIAVSTANANIGTPDAHLARVTPGVSPTPQAIANMASTIDILDTGAAVQEQQNSFQYWDAAAVAGAAAASLSGYLYNVPVWANAKRCPRETFRHNVSGTSSPDASTYLAFVIDNAPSTMAVYYVRFFVAEGL
jgi:hypothetical protein